MASRLPSGLIATRARRALALVAIVTSGAILTGCMALGHMLVLPAAAAAAGYLPQPEPVERANAPGTRAVARALEGSPRVALVLGSGSLRGYAHVGVLAALEEAGVRPSLIVGSSAGSIVGALWASGVTASDIGHASQELDWSLLAPSGIPHRGLVGGEGLEDFMRRHQGGRELETLPVPFAAVATDVMTGETVVLDEGDTAIAVRASSSIPVVFEPVRARGRLLADGSLSAPTPVRVARRLGADIVIAVNVAWSPEEGSLRTPLDMLFQSMQVMAHNLNRAQLVEADVVIAPEIRSIGNVNPESRAALIATGTAAGRTAIPSIRSAIQAWTARAQVAAQQDRGSQRRE